MKKGVLGLVGISASVALICFCGDSGNNAPVEAATTVPITSLRLDSTAVPGWTDSSYVTGDTNQAWPSIDGGAIKDIEYGMRYFSREQMQNGTHTVRLDVFDFITVQNAKNMFTYSMKNLNGGVAWGTYNPSKVVILNTDYWVYVTAQINKYYLELMFSVVNSDTVFVDSCANLFYNKYLMLLK
jgi:hypothetical protein